VTLDGTAVWVAAILTNNRSDHTSYGAFRYERALRVCGAGSRGGPLCDLCLRLCVRRVFPVSQELPATYSIGALDTLYTYTGAKPWTNDALTVISDVSGPPWVPGAIHTTENWAAFLNDGQWGFGVLNVQEQMALAGFHGPRGTGGPSDDSTGCACLRRSPTCTNSPV
jgi:hypothetical protein